MKNLSKPLQLALVIGLPIAIVAIAVGIYFVGDRNVQNTDESTPTNECNETQEYKDDILRMYEEDYLPMTVYPPVPVPQVPVEHDKIADLEGECEVYALEQAYEYGARELRDLSDCWDKCLVTQDYVENRISWAQKDGVIVYISTG